jgi:long-chain acyl-CoA synthetase
VRSFPEQFAATVARFADRPAVSIRGPAGTRRFTYCELDAMSRRAAGRLASAGLVAGDRCALLAENGPEWCAAYLAVLRLGAIAVPLDTNYSAGQVATLVRDSGARLLVVSERFATPASGVVAGERLLPLARVVADDSGEGSSVQEPSIDGSAPAVILYTSGTTADPKGVVLTHANLLAEKDGAFSVVHVDERDVVLGVLPLFHSLAQMANLLLPFSIGAHVVFLETLNTQELLKALNDEGVSVFACVPQFFYLIHGRVMDQVKKGGFATRLAFGVLTRLNRWLRGAGLNLGRLFFGRVHRTIGHRMRLLITGGSRFDPAIGRDLNDLGLTILQAYGLTETSGASTVTRLDDPIATVGRPLAGVEIRIAPPASGADDGEILIRAGVVMRGYWNRPEATAEVLRNGWLRTGDLGRLDTRGCLTITGRSKEIIVLGNGKNIYPEEIEAGYAGSPFIKELAVLGVQSGDARGDERLHAVVVPDLDALRARRVVNTQELIRFELEGLSVHLPPHKRVLSFDVSMDPLPRTTTGKLKRREISALAKELGARRTAAAAKAEDDDAQLEPHVASVVAAVQAHVTGATVRAASNFELDLGLDSMERVELLASLEQQFGARIPEDVAQQAFTVRQLAEAFRNPGGTAAGAPPDWGTLLADQGVPDVLSPVLRRRPIAGPLYFAVARVVLALVGRPKVSGLEHLPTSGAFIISPNHQSYLDPFLVGPVLPYGVFARIFEVGAAEYFETPLMRWIATQLNVVPVDPDANLLPAMQAAAAGLRRGRVLMLFPEGERSIDGSPKKFKKGAAILARHLGVPIVPAAITGAFEVWARGRELNWMRLLPWSRHRLTVTFGPPVAPRPGESEDAITARLKAEVERMWRAALST